MSTLYKQCVKFVNDKESTLPFLTHWLNEILMHACISPDALMDILQSVEDLGSGDKASIIPGRSSVYDTCLRRMRSLYQGAHFETLAQINEYICGYMLRYGNLENLFKNSDNIIAHEINTSKSLHLMLGQISPELFFSYGALNHAGLQPSRIDGAEQSVIRDYQTCYLRCIHLHRYDLATAHLHRFFDHAIAQKGHYVLEYHEYALMYTAALQIAVIYFLRGHTEMARLAFHEGFRIALQNLDSKYSTLALCWLHYIAPGLEKDSSLSAITQSGLLRDVPNSKSAHELTRSLSNATQDPHTDQSVKTMPQVKMDISLYSLGSFWPRLRGGNFIAGSRALELRHALECSNWRIHLNADYAKGALTHVFQKRKIAIARSIGLIWNGSGHFNMAALNLLISRRVGLPWMLKSKIAVEQKMDDHLASKNVSQPLRWLNKRASLENWSNECLSRSYLFTIQDSLPENKSEIITHLNQLKRAFQSKTNESSQKYKDVHTTSHGSLSYLSNFREHANTIDDQHVHSELFLAEKFLTNSNFAQSKMLFFMIMPKLIEHGPLSFEARAWFGLAKCEVLALNKRRETYTHKSLRKTALYLERALAASKRAQNLHLAQLVTCFKEYMFL